MKRLRGGFTLIEVLLAIALLLSLTGAMFGFLFGILSTRARALEHVRQHDAANTLIRQLDADLASCVIDDQRHGSGIKGDQTTLRILTRGVAIKLAAHPADNPDVLGDLQFTEYRFDEPHKRIAGRRGPASGDDPAAAALDFSPLEGVIHKLRFRYYDGEAWTDSFDSLHAKRLPRALEVALWFTWPSQSEPSVSDDVEAAPLLAAGASQMNFDEDAFAVVSDAMMSDEPRPDRSRVIIIPDADAQPEPATAPGAAASQPTQDEQP